MKKELLLPLVLSVLFLPSCDNRTPEQKAKEDYEAQKQEQMKREVYIDSVVNVALGVGKYEYMRENRINALNILREEYPSMIQKWDSIETSISLNR